MIYYYWTMFGYHHPRLRYAWHNLQGHETARNGRYWVCRTCRTAWLPR